MNLDSSCLNRETRKLKRYQKWTKRIRKDILKFLRVYDPQKIYELETNNINYNIELEQNYPKAFIVYRFAIDKKITFSSNEYQKYNIIIDE